MLDYNPLSRHLNITNRENSNPSETQVQYCVHSDPSHFIFHRKEADPTYYDSEFQSSIESFCVGSASFRH